MPPPPGRLLSLPLGKVSLPFGFNSIAVVTAIVFLLPSPTYVVCARSKSYVSSSLCTLEPKQCLKHGGPVFAE